MKKREVRVSAAMAVVAFSLLASPAPLSADVHAAPSISPAPEPFKGTFEQFKIAREAYIAEMKLRNEKIKQINISFKSAVEKANSDYRAAISSARTLDQRSQISSQRKTAITAAIVARDLAIFELGEEPMPPQEPLKLKKAPVKGKGR
jgi:hypothetical protein